MNQRRSNKDSFEHFYLTKVALGDCCGCAERVIDWRDIEHAASRRTRQPARRRWFSGVFKSWFKKEPE